mmetsp:Transcript_20729/g.34889  ORF Transcript_20729/g.34889 Transcript_20729/m.34889 type:complete len:121 (-) Transcript_20729:738-1100(-)
MQASLTAKVVTTESLETEGARTKTSVKGMKVCTGIAGASVMTSARVSAIAGAGARLRRPPEQTGSDLIVKFSLSRSDGEARSGGNSSTSKCSYSKGTVAIREARAMFGYSSFKLALQLTP